MTSSARVEHDADVNPVSVFSAEGFDVRPVMRSGAGRRFHFYRNDRTILHFDNHVNFQAMFVPKMFDGEQFFRPG